MEVSRLAYYWKWTGKRERMMVVLWRSNYYMLKEETLGLISQSRIGLYCFSLLSNLYKTYMPVIYLDGS
jgi:hypothetical protein